MKRIGVFLVILALFSAVACTSSPKVLRKAAVLIVPAQVQDVELIEISKALESIDYSVTVAGVDGQDIKGVDGGTFVPDTKASEIKEADYDVIVGIGGMGVFDILEDTSIISLFQDFHSSGKYTTAICGSSAILANAGLLHGIQATTFPYGPLIQILKDNGAEYVDTEVVVSGKIITGNGPGASVAFGAALVEALK